MADLRRRRGLRDRRDRLRAPGGPRRRAVLRGLSPIWGLLQALSCVNPRTEAEQYKYTILVRAGISLDPSSLTLLSWVELYSSVVHHL